MAVQPILTSMLTVVLAAAFPWTASADTASQPAETGIMGIEATASGVAPVHIDPANPEYPLGYWNWITFAASDFARSAVFYDRILGFMGYRRTIESGGYILWQTLYGAVGLQPAAASTPAAPVAGTAGIAQFVFYAPGTADVDRFAALLAELDAEVIDGPRAMPELMPGMYGVFFADPDGASLGLVHQPANFP
jgi:catechol 2,3-dioxygenase-like lactoylglutathione lyase family enzyme